MNLFTERSVSVNKENTNETQTLDNDEERHEKLLSSLDAASIAGEESSTATPSGKKLNKNKFAKMMSKVEKTPSNNTVPCFSQVVGGRIVGASANEPAWTDEQLRELSTLCSAKIDTIQVDREQEDERRREARVRHEDGRRHHVSHVQGRAPVLDPEHLQGRVRTAEAGDEAAQEEVVLRRRDRGQGRDVVAEPVDLHGRDHGANR
jgi:hypothetical protein